MDFTVYDNCYYNGPLLSAIIRKAEEIYPLESISHWRKNFSYFNVIQSKQRICGLHCALRRIAHLFFAYNTHNFYITQLLLRVNAKKVN